MDLVNALIHISIGLFAGICSGAFGIGGGITTTPLVRCILGYPGLVALGTALPVTVPTAISGTAVFHKQKLIVYKIGLVCAAAGSGAGFLGAFVTSYFTSMQMMLIISAAIFFVAVKFILSNDKQQAISTPEEIKLNFENILLAVTFGLVAGFLSGFLGIGGGIILVPALVIGLKFSIKQSIGTSLMVISIQAVPGAVEHYLLGHINIPLMLTLMLGSVIGAQIGARFSVKAKEKNLRLMFAIFLFAVSMYLGISELIGLNR